MPLRRLNLTSLPTAEPTNAVTLPLVDPHSLTIGIVHFGIGAFHRAHQAVYTEDASAVAGETRWGILGVTGRTDAVVRQLLPQDCLYGVLVKGADETALRLVGIVRDVAWPGDRSPEVVEALAAPATQLATLTITEKGYLRAPGGGIDLESRDVSHDLELIDRELAGRDPVEASRTPVGLLVRGLARRFRTTRAPFTVVSCDNLAHNGAVTRELVVSLVSALPNPAALLDWISTFVTFPSTMVDRIAPATTERDREEALGLLGLADDALVVAEPFGQWVIEDDFAGDRPRWELAGAILTDDVAPYEAVKLRILNATHSLLAWLGALRGHRTIAEAVSDEKLRRLCIRMIDEDIIPTLTAPAGMDLAEYRDSVLERFANPSLAHTTAQVAMDGSQKLPNRVLGAVADRLAAGAVPNRLALAIAAWITYIAGTGDPTGPDLIDPLASRLSEAVPSTAMLYADPAAAVTAILAIGEVFPRGLRDSQPLAEAIATALVTVRSLVDQTAPRGFAASPIPSKTPPTTDTDTDTDNLESP